MQSFPRLIFIGSLALLACAAPNASAQEKPKLNPHDAATLLLNPLTPDEQQYAARFILKGQSLDAGSPLAPLIAAARDGGARGRTARLHLYSIIGLSETAAAIKVGPVKQGQSFAQAADALYVAGLKGWETFDLAEQLAASTRPDFRQLGLRMLDAMSRANSTDLSEDGAKRQERIRIIAAAAPGTLEPLGPLPPPPDLAMLKLAADSRSYDARTVLRCFALWDHPTPEARAAAKHFWDSMLVNDKLDDVAAVALTNILPESAGEPRERILGYLDKASEKGRAYATSRLMDAFAAGDPQAEAVLKRWDQQKHPSFKMAQAISKVAPRYPHEFRAWFQAAQSSPTEAGEWLAIFLLSQDRNLKRDVADVAARAPEELGSLSALIRITSLGVHLESHVIRSLTTDADTTSRHLLPLLRSESSEVFRAALESLAAIGVTDAAVAKALTPLLKSSDRTERVLAATALGTAAAQRIAYMPDLVAELRHKDPNIRREAALRALRDELDRPEVLKALVTAVTTGDMPVREGLIMALERAIAQDQTALDVLAKADEETDPTVRVFLRAGKRAVGK